MNLFPKSEIEQSIPTRFEKQVTQYPDRLAIKDGQRGLSYRQLNREANQVASALLKRGLDRGPVVTLCDQGSSLIAATLGILKAGLFYSPLDPQASPDLILKLLRSLGPEAIVLEGHCLQTIENLNDLDIPILQVDSLEESLSVANPDIQTEPSAPASIYFTSGSTGTPKGVIDSHRNLLHNVMRYTNSLGITHEDRLSLLHAPDLSACSSSQFGALLNGASVFPKRIQPENISSLPGWLVKEEITIYHSVPDLLRFALNQNTRNSKLRWIRLEGDQSRREDLSVYQDFAPPACRLVNGLGTTETGICRQFFFDKRTPLPSNTVPVGYAIEDMDVYTIGSTGAFQKEGPGEIAVSSSYLCLGYWKDPDKTSKRFLQDPNHPDRRVWKSGDRGNLLDTGCLEFLGRQASGVKKQTIGKHACARQPTSPTEKSLNALCGDLLPGSEIDMESNLLELGGTSLTALRLINKIEKDHSIRLSFGDVFDAPSLTELAALIETRLGN
ncbi:MAG: non-ribosomal peptide synthetase [Cyanothece sp. SIO1E1]|nr:non-ribosomal peptide synthetase [Cyanothece sp. SIO1E1]